MPYSSGKEIQYKTWRMLRSFLLLCIVFFIQQYSFAFLRNHNGYLSLHSGIYSGKCLTQELPQKNGYSIHSLEAEVEVKEDEEIRQFEESSCFLANLFHLNETAFSTSLRARFRNSIHSAPVQSERPLFLLYHSWKSHLS